MQNTNQPGVLPLAIFLPALRAYLPAYPRRADIIEAVAEIDRINAALAEAQRHMGELPTPPNEANTCDWVIRPLLMSLGYLNHEVHAQSGDVSNKFPDYTILPNSEHTWYLEAKSWTVGLDSLHVDQALNYAHSNGQRWVVLSNGREWRLYDDRIPGKSADRLVATARLEDTEGMTRFLRAIGRESMVAKKVESYASERRVRDYLAGAIIDPNSPVIQAILKVVRQNVESANTTAGSIVDILNASQSTAPSEPSVQIQPTPIQVPNSQGAGPLYIKSKHLVAEGFYRDGKLTLRKGSMMTNNPVPSLAGTHRSRIEHGIQAGEVADRGTHYELLKDKEFGSPSGASDYILGFSSNGWTTWKDAGGTVLDALCPRTRVQKWRQGWSGPMPAEVRQMLDEER